MLARVPVRVTTSRNLDSAADSGRDPQRVPVRAEIRELLDQYSVWWRSARFPTSSELFQVKALIRYAVLNCRRLYRAPDHVGLTTDPGPDLTTNPGPAP